MGKQLDIDNSHLLTGPLHIAFDVTNKCMAKCLHCFNRSGNELPREELSDSQFLNIIDQLAEAKVFSVCYCGGEPLIRYEILVEATKRLKKAGVANINMVSNGWLLTQEKANKLAEAGMTMIQISLDGSTAETHEKMRGMNGIFNKALEAMQMVTNANMQLSTSFSPTKFNIHQFPEVVRMERSFKSITSIRIQPLMPMGKASDPSEDLLPEEEDYRRVVKFITEFNAKNKGKLPIIEWGDPLDHLRRFTSVKFKQLSFVEIKSDGLISASSYLPFKVGNLCKHTLKEYWDAGLGQIWNLPILRELADRVLCIEDLGTEKPGIPKVFFDNDIIIDLIDDKPFSNIDEFTLKNIVHKKYPQFEIMEGE
jgi:MoaA/NifB/PqqE/SkfB family radical SAM enzyme